MSDNIINVTDASFEAEVLNSDIPVLVDYWAEWCGPCKMIAPVLEEIADDYAGRLTVAKLNIDDNSEYSSALWYSWHSNADVVQEWPCRRHQGRSGF